jgi:hypothetical protein
MRESVTYQAIVAEGALEEAQKMLFLVGSKPFGRPDRATRAAVQALGDLRRLEELAQRIFEVRSWQELLDQPTRPRRRRSGG